MVKNKIFYLLKINNECICKFYKNIYFPYYNYKKFCTKKI